jgi:outer membrane protein OmpA-like peptidoglycan-associated protein
MVIGWFQKYGADKIIVTGGSPSSEVSKMIEDAVRQAFPSRPIDASGLKIEAVAQYEDWVDKPLARFLSEFARRSLGDGVLKLEVREASLLGTVPNEMTRDALGLYLGWALGASFSVNNLLSVELKAKVPAPYEGAQVLFAEGSALIGPKEQTKINTFAARLTQGGEGVVLLKAFSSKSGTLAANLAIGAKRADAVRAELVRLGIAEDRMQVQPTGKPGSGGRGDASDRRVELIILE